MSVHDPEPKIPNDDNGKGLRMIGWFLLLWTLATIVWIPFHLRWTSYMAWVDAVCFGAGLSFVGIGYWVQRKTPSDIEMNERCHDMMAATGDGQQNDEFAAGDGPGRFPRPVTR
jgi:hypothetical protein